MCNNCGNGYRFNGTIGGGACLDNDCERYKDYTQEALVDLEFDIKMIRCGIEDIKKGISMVCRGCVCDGIAKLKTGACNFEMGVNNLIARFESGCFDVGCKSRRLIDEAICSLKEAICLIYEGIEAIENGCIEEGIAKLRKAICNAEEGLCDLMAALKRLC